MDTSRDGITPFTDRAAAYARFRPGYPSALVQHLKEHCGLEPGSRVADVGSGTGIWTEMMLKAGAGVLACEPNPAMRAEAEARLGEDPGFVSLEGRAEDLPIDDSSMDLVTCAQSFHWFDQAAAMKEFDRVLHGAGWIALFWNEWEAGGSPATQAVIDLEARVRGEADRTLSDRERLRPLFLKGTSRLKEFRHLFSPTAEEFAGLCRSRSWWPESVDAESEAEALMKSHGRAGRLPLQLACRLIVGMPR
ncbi:MAG: class I SAM-dependent methyltransferase [Fimbriimonadaceae bacterium]|nr:class I SAM-dependent methyltransferase [Fimbriimonadaceae bacterium]